MFVLTNKNVFFEHTTIISKTTTIFLMTKFVVLKMDLFTFLELPSMGFFLYYIKMHCPTDGTELAVYYRGNYFITLAPSLLVMVQVGQKVRIKGSKSNTNSHFPAHIEQENTSVIRQHFGG
jgi:hypothetical protein